MNIAQTRIRFVVLAVFAFAFLAFAAPAFADPPAEPAAPIEVEQLDEFMIVPPPGDFETQTTIPEQAPKIEASEFGIGWPAAIAVGVALLAVLAMAIFWRRDEAF